MKRDRHVKDHLRWLVLLLSTIVVASSAVAGEVYVPIGPYGSGIELTEPVKSIKELRTEGLTLQQLDYSCGSAALATIFTSYLGIPCAEKEVIDYIVTTGNLNEIAARRGFSLLDLKRFAESKGVKAIGYRLDMSLLTSLQCPVLVPLYLKAQNNRHFTIFLGAKDGWVYLADPAMGRHTITQEEFLAEWDPSIGMVFSRPEMRPLHETALAIRPVDDTHMATSTTLSLALTTGVPYLNVVNEF